MKASLCWRKEHAPALPDAVQPVVSLVVTYVRQGRPHKAEALLKDMIKKYPQNAADPGADGPNGSLRKRKTDEAATATSSSAITKQPKDPSGYSALSDFYIRQKNYNAAAEVNPVWPQGTSGQRHFAIGCRQPADPEGRPTRRNRRVYEANLEDQPNSMVAINNLVNLLLDFRS